MSLIVFHLPFPAFVFDQDGNFQEASQAAKVHADGQSYTQVFAGNPELIEKIQHVYQEKIRYQLAEDQIEICPLLDTDQQLQGVMVIFFEQDKVSVFHNQSLRSEILERAHLIAKGLAHEIRNPLAGLKGAAQLLSKNQDKPELVQDYCDIIVKESDRLNRLVTNLMELGKAPKLHLAPVNIHKPLRDVIQMTALASGKQQRIEEKFDPSLPSILANSDALEQIFLNLIRNAEEATNNQESPIILKTQAVTDFWLKTENKRQQMLCVQVIDKGEGISDEDLDKIFTPYYSTKTQGAGLGLSIANHLTQQQGGSLNVESELGQGTTVSVYLPMTKT